MKCLCFQPWIYVTPCVGSQQFTKGRNNWLIDVIKLWCLWFTNCSNLFSLCLFEFIHLVFLSLNDTLVHSVLSCVWPVHFSNDTAWHDLYHLHFFCKKYILSFNFNKHFNFIKVLFKAFLIINKQLQIRLLKPQTKIMWKNYFKSN